MKEFLQNYIFIYIGIISLLTFLMYGADKQKAKKHKWRIPEKTLLGLCIVGGFFGGLLGMQVFHHKTKHWNFYAINILALILWVFIIYKVYV